MRPVIAEEGKKYSLEEYIKIDEEGIVRHEYFDGKLIPMPGETKLHNKLCINLLIALKTNLKSSFQVFIENVKVKIEGEDKFVYPDIAVEAEEPAKHYAYKNYIIYAPVLVAEMLSDSTRKYDLTDKFILYQKISTLRYYLIVEPEKHVVIFYEKNDEGEWLAKTYTELNEVIEFKSLNASIQLQDIYSS